MDSIDTNQNVSFHYKDSVFTSNCKISNVPHGATISQMVAFSGIPAELAPNVRVFIGDTLVERERWGLVKPKPNSNVYIAIAPKGDVLKFAAVIAVSFFAPQIAQFIAPGLSGVGLKVLTAGIGLVGNLLVNALFPPPSPQSITRPPTESPTLSISGQSNQKDPYGPVRRVYGTHKVYPVVAAEPFTETVGNTQFLYAIYDFGYGPLKVEDIAIGNTPIAQFENVQYRIVEDNNFTIYTNDVAQDQIGAGLNNTGDSETRNTFNNANGFGVDFAFNGGLTGFNKDGSRTTMSVDFRVEYREQGATQWLSATDADVTVSGSNVQVGSSSDIVLTPQNYTVSLNFTGDEGGGVFSINGYIGFDFRGPNPQVAYSSGTPEVGKNLLINGFKYKIVSFDASFITVSNNNGGPDHVPLARCQKSYDGFGYSFACPTVGPYNTKVVADVTDGAIRISANRQNAVLAAINVNGLDAANYEVRVTRIGQFGGGDFQNSDDATWNILKTYKNNAPIDVSKPHTFLELKIKATDELSGVIQTLNALCTSILDVYDDTAQKWIKQPTSNPAWIFADIITGNATSKRLTQNRIDTASLTHWANFCDQEVNTGEGKRFTCNFVVDYNTTAKELLNQVTACGRATYTVFDGLYGVVIDEEKTIPKQHFTPRNSSDFSSSRTYIDVPHAIKVKFIDPDNNWNLRERIVYADGFDENNANIFEEIDAFGVIDANQAYRFGRYMIAQGLLRQEKIQLSVDFEGLTSNKGDLVKLTHDVMKVGGLPARIVNISGNQIKIDEQWVPDVGTYIYEHRYAGNVESGSIVSVDSNDEFTVDDASNMQIGDLIVVGLLGQVSIDCLIQSIEYDGGFNANLTLVEYAPAIFSADTEAIPAYDPRLTDGEMGSVVGVTGLSVTENLTYNIDGTANTLAILSWNENTLIFNSDVYLSVDGLEPELISSTEQDVFNYEYIVKNEDLGLPHKFYVDARNYLGNNTGYLTSPSVSITPFGDIFQPDNVENFRLSVIKETIQLEWDQVIDPSLSHYEIRYSPDETGAMWDRSQILIDRVAKNVTSTAVSSRVGTYLIKAVDGSGNYSAAAAQARTTIPILTDLNAIDTRNDAPLWNGSRNSVIVESGDLILPVAGNGYAESGWYEYEDLIDLGQIYTARISNKIKVSGRSIADLLSEWDALANVNALQTFNDSDFSAKVYVRSASSLSVLADWVTLDSVDFLAQSTDWTEWRELTTGNYTGRYFQFAIELKGNGRVTPVVRDGLIEIDMPDRLDSDENIVSGIGGYNVTYSPSFRVKPSLQITMDGAQTGDYFNITNSTRTGFDIEFFDSTNSSVSRQFDWSAKGYGAQANEVI